MNAWRALLLIPLGCQQGHQATQTRPTDGAAEAAQPAVHDAGAPAPDTPRLATTASAERVEPPWPPTPPAGVSSDFCIELVNALDEETCYALPDTPTKDLLLYLHGIVPPARDSAVKTNFETVVGNASRRAGVAALIPRGRQGLAPRGHPGWWGWPTSGEGYARLAPELVENFVAKRKALEELVGQRFERWFVAGSSSGAYFTAALALNGGIEADGFGAMSGGALSARADFTKLSPRPFYIGYGTRDSVGPSARALGERLKQAGWPVLVAAHPLGHGANEVYLDEAFAFWREPRSGP